MSDTGAPTGTPGVDSIAETIASSNDLAAVIDDWDVSTAAAWVVLFAVCIFFAILAVGSMGKFACLPPNIQGLCLLNKNGEETNTVDYFLSARNSAGFLSITLSYFASGMGAWVVYGTTEMGANPMLSWLGVLGYSGAAAFPAAVICFVGPVIKARCTDKAFSTSDFGRERYGRVMQLSISVISIFYMFIYVVAELTSISGIFALLTGNGSKGFGIGITVVIGIVTLSYTAYAGLPASIVTDRFQGVIMAFLVIVLTIAICSFDENKVTKEEFKLASSWTVEGLMAMVTLVIAILCAELFNQATWQRVWAAESVPALRKGFALGSFMIFVLMMFFGIMGMIAYSKDPVRYDVPFDENGVQIGNFAFLAFFDLLLPLGNAWHVIVLIVVTALCASSLDSLQNGLNSMFYRDSLRLGINAHVTASVLVLVMNIPAIWIASLQYSVLSLFLVADLVCATAILPVFLGLQETNKLGGLLPAPTELGAFLGIISGIATVLVNGAINDAGLFQYFWLRNDAICALCGKETMITFIVTPLIAGFMTYVFTLLDIAIRGEEKARKPLIQLPIDIDDEHESNDENGPADGKVIDVDDKADDKDVESKVNDEEALKEAVSAEADA